MEHTIQTKHSELSDHNINQQSCSEISLRKREVLRLKGNRTGTRIQALHGRAWITLTGQDQDILLLPGQSYTIQKNGKVVIQGMPTANVRIDPC